MKSLGCFIRYVRKTKGLTQEQIAESLNIVTPVFSKWENDKAVPSLELLCKLCNILNVSIEECVSAELTDGEKLLPPENYDSLKLGETLKRLRIKNGWSQAEVGKKLFVTSQTVSKWEAGGVASLEVLENLATVFSVTPTQLVNGFDCQSPKSVNDKIEQSPKPKNFAIKITAVILSVIIIFGAVAGIIAGIILRNTDGEEIQTPADLTQPEPPTDDGQENPEPENTAFCLPVQSEIYRGWLDEYIGNLGSPDNHKGVDFLAEAGDEVYAVADGVIIRIYFHSVLNYGFIRIEHSDGLISGYWGVIAEDNLSVGDEIKKGDIIGAISEDPFIDELYDEPHLHFILQLNGEYVNPLDYIPYKN